MDPMFIIYSSGQIQAQETAPEVLKHLCFVHNAFQESKDYDTAELLKEAILSVNQKKLSQVDALNAFYEDSRVTNCERYYIDSSKNATISGQLIIVSSKGGKPTN